MTNQFFVELREIALLDEAEFLALGGKDLHFGEIENGTVSLFVHGSPQAVRTVARNIITHHTSAH